MTAPAIVVRPLSAGDIRAVAEIRVCTWRAAYAGIVPQPYLDGMSIDFEEERRRAAFAGPDHPTRTLVADWDGSVAGFAVVGPSRDSDAAGAGEVHALYVRPDAQHRGVGQALLRHAAADLHAHGHRRATLWVLEDNAAGRRFYERAGWRADGARHLYVRTGADLLELRYAVALD